MKTYSRKKVDDQEEVIVDLDELCRLCMNKEEELHPIFESDEAVSFPLRIMACVSLEVLEDDGLPNKMCHPCKMLLEKFYMFRKKCENSDLKLRHHVKALLEKLGEIDSDIEDRARDESEIMTSENDLAMVDHEISTTEQALVGVTQVTYITPDVENDDDPIEITLPAEEELKNRDACTLDAMHKPKKEILEEDQYYVMDEDQEDYNVGIEHQDFEGQDLDFIAEAVKSTLATHPNLNLTGDIQMKVEQEPGKPTQVSVTTDDGSVIVMELTNEEQPQEEPAQSAASSSQEDEESYTEDGELKVFQCPECPKSFSRRIQLRRHSSVHMKQRGFSCGICEKWFPTKSALIRHERIHTGERPFQCEVCQRCFAQKEILFRHLMTHSGMKPYDCPHCSKGFKQKESLKAHLKTHLDVSGVESEQMFHYCTLCPKVFCHASGLSRHLVTHTGRTFKCRDCDKKFNDKSSLLRHFRRCSNRV